MRLLSLTVVAFYVALTALTHLALTHVGALPHVRPASIVAHR
jgi:hypothetical protein